MFAGAITAGCTAAPGLAGPSPIIVPDVAVTRVGGSQTFSVFNATVRQFSLRSAGRPWTECVQVDQSVASDRTIRVVVTASCQGLLYITADIGEGRSPLIAALTTE